MPQRFFRSPEVATGFRRDGDRVRRPGKERFRANDGISSRRDHAETTLPAEVRYSDGRREFRDVPLSHIACEPLGQWTETQHGYTRQEIRDSIRALPEVRDLIASGMPKERFQELRYRGSKRERELAKTYEAFYGDNRIELSASPGNDVYEVDNGRHRVELARELEWQDLMRQRAAERGRVEGTDFAVDVALQHPDGTTVRLPFVEFKHGRIVTPEIPQDGSEKAIRRIWEEAYQARFGSKPSVQELTIDSLRARTDQRRPTD